MPTFPAPRLWFPGECEPFDTAFNPAKIHKVIDADTIDLLLDLGRDVRGYVMRIRLTGESWIKTGRKIGFDAWEKRGAEKVKGDLATERVEELLPVGTMVRTRSWKGGARGSLYRWLDLVLVRCKEERGRLVACGDGHQESCGWYSLADILLHEGHGEEWWKGRSRGAPRPV